MRNAASPYLQSVTLFDQFTGKNIPEGRRSLAFSLSYQKEDGTFTDEEIQNLQKKLGDSLRRLYQVEFRS
jgi:phenylalanyl-tRNA synthetase beta chain